MAHERRALDVCTTPPLTPTAANGASLEDNENRNAVAEGKSDTNKVEYTLKPATRVYASTARLNLQHYIWKDQCGFLLHPSIPLDSRPDLKIADVGTGTGIWLLDLARTLPLTAQLDGFDIDISDCPPAAWLPANVRMRRLDALGSIPEDLLGVYDVVHMRLFQVVVKDNDPGPLLRNAVSMLKPNGHLQWSEYDSTTLRTLHASPSLPSSSLRAIPAFVSALKPHDPHARIGEQDWISRLPELFETLTTDTPASSTPAYSTPASSTLNANSAPALTCILSSRYATSPAWLPYQLDVFLLTYDELAGKVLDHLPGVGGEGEGVGREGVRREGSETAGSKLRTLIEQAREEGKRGVGWGIDRLVVVGRKRGAEGEGEGGKKKVAGGVGHVKGEEEGGKMLKSDENAIDDVGGGDGNGNLEQASPAPGPSALPVPPSTTTLQKDTSHPPPTPRTPRRTNRNLRSKWKRVWNRMRMVSR